jgi:purine catabolism regulator
MSITVNRLLELDKFSECKVIAGYPGLEKEVTIVNIMDAPDIINWVKKGELILTTGYVIKDDINLQKKLIKDLKSRGCSGLAIKLKRFIEMIPEEIIKIADELNFPLIELPLKYSLSEILQLISAEIINSHVNKLQRSQEIQKELTQIALRGEGLTKLSEVISRIIKTPILIMDRKFRVLAMPKSLQENLNSSLDMKESLLTLKDLVNNTEFIDNSFIKGRIDFINEILDCFIYYIKPETEVIGYIVVLSSKDKTLKERDHLALEQALTVVALEILKAKSIKETRLRIRADFFDDLLTGKFDSDTDLDQLGPVHGLDLSKKYSCVIVNVEDFQKLRIDKLADDNKRLWRIVKEVELVINKAAQKEQFYVATIIRRNKIVMLLEGFQGESDKENKNRCITFANKIHEVVHVQLTEANLTIGIGKRYSVLDFYNSYNEALKSAELGRKLTKKGFIFYIDDFKIYNLLKSSFNYDVLKHFHNTILNELIKYDNDNNTNLLETLEYYFRCNGNISQASKEMFIHRNTFIYRFEKIKEILNNDLISSDELFEIQLAIKIGRLLTYGSE